jgi:ABC-type branched-subunit amino acid transport system substrate-binding protein
MTKQNVGGGNGRASCRCVRLVILAITLAALNALAMPDTAIAAEPIKIGFSMALTGAHAGNGKAALLATQMWADDQNARGGLLGRPVQGISMGHNAFWRTDTANGPSNFDQFGSLAC